MDKGVWEEVVREDADKEVMGPCDRCEERVCTEEGKGLPIVKRGERGGERICEGAVKEGLHLAIKVTANSAGVLCRKERWQKEDSTKLQIFK